MGRLVGYVVVLSSLLQKLLLYSGACGRDEGDEGVLGGGTVTAEMGGSLVLGTGGFSFRRPRFIFFGTPGLKKVLFLQCCESEEWQRF